MDFRSTPCKNRKNSRLLLFLAVYHAHTGIIFVVIFSPPFKYRSFIFFFLQYTVRTQGQYLFFFVFRRPQCTHRNRP
jgi:hypothetical protein